MSVPGDCQGQSQAHGKVSESGLQVGFWNVQQTNQTIASLKRNNEKDDRRMTPSSQSNHPRPKQNRSKLELWLFSNCFQKKVFQNTLKMKTRRNPFGREGAPSRNGQLPVHLWLQRALLRPGARYSRCLLRTGIPLKSRTNTKIKAQGSTKGKWLENLIMGKCPEMCRMLFCANILSCANPSQ